MKEITKEEALKKYGNVVVTTSIRFHSLERVKAYLFVVNMVGITT